jgi:hypothetical protein
MRLQALGAKPSTHAGMDRSSLLVAACVDGLK